MDRLVLTAHPLGSNYIVAVYRMLCVHGHQQLSSNTAGQSFQLTTTHRMTDNAHPNLIKQQRTELIDGAGRRNLASTRGT